MQNRTQGKRNKHKNVKHNERSEIKCPLHLCYHSPTSGSTPSPVDQRSPSPSTKELYRHPPTHVS
uniref:Uncharacterized protein n=1 Tax=Romanomermis culicivorax TaxID=13658 RepID=A0A915HPD4_ROMCU